MEIAIAVVCVLGIGFAIFDKRRRTKKLEELSAHPDAVDKDGFIALHKQFGLTRKEMRIFHEFLQFRFKRNDFNIAVHFKLDKDFNLTFEEIKDLINDFCMKTIVWTPKSDHFESFQKDGQELSSISDVLKFFKWWKTQVVDLA